MARTLTVEVSAIDVPEVLTALVAARDVVDHADTDNDGGHEIAIVPMRDFRRLEMALVPLLPGADVDVT